MLKELRIDQFAIIEHLDLEPGAGLIIFTGETGAGKSIILDALDALLGGRLDQSMIRSGSALARLEAVFEIDPASATQSILEREGLSEGDPIVTLEREIKQEGRSSARINGHSVSVSLLKEVGEDLVDIHGQSEHLSLMNVRSHLRLLDTYGGHAPLLIQYEKIYRQLQTLRKELRELQNAKTTSEQRIDLVTYQLNEIRLAHLQTGEEESLIQERNRLANADHLAQLIQDSRRILEESTPDAPSLSDLLGELQHTLTTLVKVDPGQSGLRDQIDTISEEIADITRTLSRYSETVEINPRRLEQVEERLEVIQRLIKKYGGTIEAVHQYAEHAQKELDQISGAEERIQGNLEQEKALLKELASVAGELSRQRDKSAVAMTRAVEQELNDLSMAGSRFVAEIRRSESDDGLLIEANHSFAFDANGCDQVEFLIAPNPGEGLKPMVKIASGGETSRLMLALKNVLARADRIPTLVFDEIDQGIGGKTGLIVGKKLWNLARNHQVFCVTHLPQLAAYGDIHYHVGKETLAGRTRTVVTRLSTTDREREIAGMQGTISETTLQSARELFQLVEQSTHPLA